MKDIWNLKQVETAPSSPLFKAATKIYNLVRKKKNLNQGKKMFVKVEEDNLKNYVVKVEEKEEKDEEEKNEEEKHEEEREEKKKDAKRKHFCELTSKKSKKARLSNVVNILKNDIGLEDELFEKMRKEKCPKEGD